jgi:hypothetical protein
MCMQCHADVCGSPAQLLGWDTMCPPGMADQPLNRQASEPATCCVADDENQALEQSNLEAMVGGAGCGLGAGLVKVQAAVWVKGNANYARQAGLSRTAGGGSAGDLLCVQGWLTLFAGSCTRPLLQHLAGMNIPNLLATRS